MDGATSPSFSITHLLTGQIDEILPAHFILQISFFILYFLSLHHCGPKTTIAAPMRIVLSQTLVKTRETTHWLDFVCGRTRLTMQSLNVNQKFVYGCGYGEANGTIFSHRSTQTRLGATTPTTILIIFANYLIL